MILTFEMLTLVLRMLRNGELQRDEGALIGGLDLLLGGLALGRLPVSAEARRADVGLVAEAAGERPFVGVQPLVQLQVHVLGEPGAALFTTVRLGAGVKPEVSLQVGGGAESLSALRASVGSLA